MKVQINDKTYYVHWEYIPGPLMGSRGVRCLIKDKETFCKGVAYCSWEDRFVKDVGRKLSLKRALANFPKEERTIFWQTYLNRK